MHSYDAGQHKQAAASDGSPGTESTQLSLLSAALMRSDTGRLGELSTADLTKIST